MPSCSQEDQNGSREREVSNKEGQEASRQAEEGSESRALLPETTTQGQLMPTACYSFSEIANYVLSETVKYFTYLVIVSSLKGCYLLAGALSAYK